MLNPSKTNSIRKILNDATGELTHCAVDSPRLDAEVLLAHFLGLDRPQLYRDPDRKLTAVEMNGFRSWIERRKKGEPVAYITGWKEFWSIPLKVNRDVLIPRPETEFLVEQIIGLLGGRTECKLLELATGSGAISVASAVCLHQVHVTATDVSPEALRVARENARMNGVADRITFLQGDLFTPVAGLFDVIASNPPYVSEEEYCRISPGVRDFEPAVALLAGPDGTEFHRALIRGATEHLVGGGWLLLEIGAGQDVRIEEMIRAADVYEEIGFVRDYSGIIRIAKARRRK